MLTAFTWGYWGWGSATKEFVRAADAGERKSGFRPPIFVDIRLRRNVRAKGFQGPAFATATGQSRYIWMRELGNRSIATRGPRIRIAEPTAVRALLDTIVAAAKERRRVLFFCNCEDPRGCHRTVVARLLLAEARRKRRALRVEEWPASKPIRQKHSAKVRR